MYFPHQQLKELLAQGNLEAALEKLVQLSRHSTDADLRRRILTLSGQFTTLKKQQLTGLLDDKDYRLELNRITAAIADIVDTQTLPERSPGRQKWGLVLIILLVLAGIAAFALRGVFLPKSVPPPPVENAVEPQKLDTLVATKPAVPQKPAGKNNLNIQVKDKAKVGTIINGDSNKIDLKQDF